MKNINRLYKLATLFQKVSNDIFESSKLMDSSIIMQGIDLARNELYQKWSAPETMDKLMRLSGGKVNQKNVDQIRNEILAVIVQTPCQILPHDEFFDKTLQQSALGTFVASEKKIYIRQMTIEWAKKTHALDNVDYFKLLMEHELTHAINDYLFKKRIYTEALLDKATIPSGKKFSPSEYIYSSDEMVARMNSVRKGFSIWHYTTGQQLALTFFENLSIPYTKEGNLYKITAPGEFAYGHGNITAIKETLEAIYQHFHPNFGWEVWELIKLTIPYVKKIQDTGPTISVWFDLDALAKSMNQVAIQDQKSEKTTRVV